MECILRHLILRLDEQTLLVSLVSSMSAKTPYEYFILTGRVLMGAWFVWLGCSKIFLVGSPAFARQVAEFEILRDPWNLMVAYFVPWLELIAGFALMVSYFHRGAVRILLGLTGLFIFVNAQAMIRGIDPDCGCFGKGFEMEMKTKMILLGVQLVALVFLMANDRSIGRSVFKGSKMRLPG